MITAEEFIKTKPVNGYGNLLNQKEAIIEFAKLHIEEALKQVSKKFDGEWNKNSILNAYSLENIK